MANEPTLSEALRLAADLIDAIGWTQGITWSGTDLHLHPRSDEMTRATHAAILGEGADPLGGEIVHCQGNRGIFRTERFLLPSGLRVDVLGPVKAEVGA